MGADGGFMLFDLEEVRPFLPAFVARMRRDGFKDPPEGASSWEDVTLEMVVACYAPTMGIWLAKDHPWLTKDLFRLSYGDNVDTCAIQDLLAQDWAWDPKPPEGADLGLKPAVLLFEEETWT